MNVSITLGHEMGAGPLASERGHREHRGVSAHHALQKAAPPAGDFLVLPHHGLCVVFG